MFRLTLSDLKDCGSRKPSYFSFSGEGPHSRGYGRTAVLRLLVQTCDKDDDDYYYFVVLFLVMEHRWNETDRGKPKY
jgi:hypothetical protein